MVVDVDTQPARFVAFFFAVFLVDFFGLDVVCDVLSGFVKVFLLFPVGFFPVPEAKRFLSTMTLSRQFVHEPTNNSSIGWNVFEVDVVSR